MIAPRHFHCGVWVALAICGGFAASAAESSRATSAARPSQVSPQIIQAVSAALPHYAPPPPAIKVPEPAGDSRSSDDVLQLPNMQVTTPKVPPSTEYDWLTLKGRIALAMKKYPGLGVGNLFGLNGGIGLAMLDEERQVQVKAALVEQADRGADDSPEARRIKRLAQAAIQRPNTAWSTVRGGKSGGP
jgi:hypothetical protein